MKRRIILVFLLTIGASAATYGHVTAPILPLPATEFKDVIVSGPVSDEIIENIADFRNSREIDSRPNVIVKNEPKIIEKRPKTPSVAEAKAYARAKLGETQYNCINKLFKKESGWSPTKYNYAGSGAYGIPQALPGSKMKSAGADWKTNPITQVKWGIKYVNRRYGSACGAWNHSKKYGWY